MSNFTWAGFWDNGTAYQANTFVTYENVVYVCLHQIYQVHHQVVILIGILLFMDRAQPISKEHRYQQ